MKERLIKEYDHYDLESLSDWLAFMARDVEDGMITAGAKPGKDYTFLDVFKLAVQIHTAKVNEKK